MSAFARRRLLYLAPLGVVGLGGFAFWTMLKRMQEGRFDPHDIGNPMLNKPIPDFELPGIGNTPGFSSKDVVQAAQSRSVMLNFFASWCIPCAAEAEGLAALVKQGVQIWGIAYKDTPEKTAEFLDKYGNPYTRLAADKVGDVFINFGLFGVPESFIIDAKGKIVWHLAGPITADMAEASLKKS